MQVKFVRRFQFPSGVQYFVAEHGTVYRGSLKRGELKELGRLRVADPDLVEKYKDDPVGLVKLCKRSRAH